MATIEKTILSGSIGGRPIKITGNATGSATTIHSTGTSSTIVDEVWLYAQNSSTTGSALFIQFGGTTEPDDLLSFGIEPKSGLFILSPGLPLSGTGQDSRSIKAYAQVTGSVNITGYVNRITP